MPRVKRREAHDIAFSVFLGRLLGFTHMMQLKTSTVVGLYGAMAACSRTRWLLLPEPPSDTADTGDMLVATSAPVPSPVFSSAVPVFATVDVSASQRLGTVSLEGTCSGPGKTNTPLRKGSGGGGGRGGMTELKRSVARSFALASMVSGSGVGPIWGCWWCRRGVAGGVAGGVAMLTVPQTLRCKVSRSFLPKSKTSTRRALDGRGRGRAKYLEVSYHREKVKQKKSFSPKSFWTGCCLFFKV
jgi:hypothetical protein